MAAIDELELEHNDLVQHQLQSGATSTQALKALLAPLFWVWFENNRDKVVTKISLFRGLVRYTLRVKDLRQLFVMLFGEQP